MSRVRFSVTICVLLTAANLVLAQSNFGGGIGLFHTQSARTLRSGYLNVSSNSYGGGIPVQNADFSFYSVGGRLNINYGLSRHFELSISSGVYQDTNRGGGGVNSPDDIRLSAKIGSFSSPGSSVSYGVILGSRIPTGDTHNLPFEPYSSDKVSFGIMSLATYSKDPLYPEESWNVSLNLGYWNHNDVGVELIPGGAPETQPTSMSQEIAYALGVSYPKKRFTFVLEMFGNAFLQAPPEAAYSRESYMYVSPGVDFKVARWFSFNLGVEWKIVNSSDKTLYDPAPGGIRQIVAGVQPNYPAWRLNVGTKFALLPTDILRVNRRDILMQKAQTRRELFEQIINEQRDTESAEAELERIRSERIRAEQELQKLRKILDKSSNDKSEKASQQKQEDGQRQGDG